MKIIERPFPRFDSPQYLFEADKTKLKFTKKPKLPLR